MPVPFTQQSPRFSIARAWPFSATILYHSQRRKDADVSPSHASSPSRQKDGRLFAVLNNAKALINEF
jgi:hypothetical protein